MNEKVEVSSTSQRLARGNPFQTEGYKCLLPTLVFSLLFKYSENVHIIKL